MKFSKEHYEFLKSRIEEVVKNLSPTDDLLFYSKHTKRRFRWDLFWKSGVKIGDGVGTSGDIIGNYNDDHIDTVLRKIVTELNLDNIGIDS